MSKHRSAGKIAKVPTAPATEPNNANSPTWLAENGSSWRGVLCLWCGWILPQLFLIGPALIGQQILLPLDLLALPNYYLASAEAIKAGRPVDQALLDLVEVDAPARTFCQREFSRGRLPLWQPDNFLGAPFTSWPKYSPFEIPYWIAPHQITLAWMRLLQVLCIGTGGWYFLRHAMHLSYWPAAIGGWLFPLIGFFTLWQGYSLTGSIAWLPWLLTAVHFAVQRPGGWGPIGLAATTALTLLSGQPDVGALTLVGSGFYAVNRLLVEYRTHVASIGKVSMVLAMSWFIGFLVAAPYWMPLIEYARTGVRMQERLAGAEERPPGDLTSLVTVVVPDAFGSTRRGSLYLRQPGSPLESSTGAFVGMLAVLWLVPIAWCDRARRNQIWFWAAIAVFGLVWQVGLPGIVDILRLRPFNVLSYNRAVFLTATAFIVLAMIGLEQLLHTPLRARPLSVIGIVIGAIGVLVFTSLALQLPEPLATEFPQAVQSGMSNYTLKDVALIQQTFIACYVRSAILFSMVTFAWLWTLQARRLGPLGLSCVASLLIADPFWFAWQESRLRPWQADYPRVSALEQLATLPAGRIWGVNCLPPNLNRIHGLSDIRGYDAVDPERFVRLLSLASDPRFQSPSFARTRASVPAIIETEDEARLHPVADMLNVRYLVSRVAPPFKMKVAIQESDYWILENSHALPRAFVPQRVERVEDEDYLLNRLQGLDFRPDMVAYVPAELNLPSDCRGRVTLQQNSPSKLELNADMETAGLVVVSNLWSPDWKAKVDGQRVEIVRTNSALCGVPISVGHHVIQLEYHPLAVRSGFVAALCGLIALSVWSARVLHRRRIELGSGGAHSTA
ncbi:MAG: YfhO family protein [Planctomycetota bacterium]